MERKKIAPLVTLSRGNAFVLGGDGTAGRERKSFCGAFKARKSGKGREDRTPAPLVTLATEKRNIQVTGLCLLSRMLYGLPIVPD